MRRMEMPTGLRRILPALTALGLLAGPAVFADGPDSNELNSPVDEPKVVIIDAAGGIPVLPVSRAVQESTDPLVKFVHETREAQRRRLLSTDEHTPWQIMHAVVGLRQDLLLRHDGGIVSGLEWISTGPTFQNEPWFSKTAHGGQAHPFNKPWWFEGHINQFAAILSMASVPLDQQFGTPDGPITMRDMVRNAQATVNSREEVTWTLWLLSRYLPPDAEWVNAKGEQWSIERLVKVEVGKPVGGPTSPCGGTHGLFALAHARNVYLRTGKPLRGAWLEAEQKIQKYIRTARLQQNSNGTLSSSFFKGREYKQEFDKRMASCGHLLEFLMMAVPQNQLNEPWLRRAIEATAKDLMDNRKEYVSCSPLYHSTNALSIYLDRVAPLTPEERMAEKQRATKTISLSKTLPKSVPPVPTQPAAVTPGAPEATDTGSNQPRPPAGTATEAPAETTPAIAPTKSAASSAPTAGPETPVPAVPVPVAPAPAEPVPAEPAPAEPAPAEPAPSAPADEVPTSPTGNGSPAADPAVPTDKPEATEPGESATTDTSSENSAPSSAGKSAAVTSAESSPDDSGALPLTIPTVESEAPVAPSVGNPPSGSPSVEQKSTAASPAASQSRTVVLPGAPAVQIPQASGGSGGIQIAPLAESPAEPASAVPGAPVVEGKTPPPASSSGPIVSARKTAAPSNDGTDALSTPSATDVSAEHRKQGESVIVSSLKPVPMTNSASDVVSSGAGPGATEETSAGFVKTEQAADAATRLVPELQVPSAGEESLPLKPPAQDASDVDRRTGVWRATPPERRRPITVATPS